MSSNKPRTKSQQSSTTKDNSSVVESDGINVTDGSMGARDNAIVSGGAITGNDTLEGNVLGIGGSLSNYKGTQNITIESVDRELVTASLDVVNDVVDGAISFGGDLVGRFDDLAQSTIAANSATTNAVVAANSYTTDRVIDGLFTEQENARESEETKTLQTLGTYLSIAVGIVTLGKIFS